MFRVFLPKIKLSILLILTISFLLSNSIPVQASGELSVWGTTSVGSVTLTGVDSGGLWSVNSFPDGSYILSVDTGWSGTITPSKPGYTFTPPERTYTALSADIFFQDYVATPITYTISGNAGVGGATLSYTDGSAKTAVADSGGDYSFDVSYDWTGTVTPTLGGYTFFPPSMNYMNVLSNQVDQNYAAVGRYSITGTIKGAGGLPIENVSVAIPGKTAVVTDAAGAYTFTDLNPNTLYTLSPSHPNFTFHPASASVNTSTAVNWVVSGIDFTGLLASQDIDATLKSLSTDYGIFNWGFQPEVTSYSISAAKRFSTLNLTPVATQALAQIAISYNGSAVALVAGAYPITPLAAGANEVNIKVTAPDGAATKTYKITINMKEDDYPVRWATNPAIVATAGSPYSYTMRATNDYRRPLVFSFEPGHKHPTWLTLTPNPDGTATLTGTPGMADLGQAQVWLQVEDASFTPALTASGAQFFIITVKAPFRTYIPVAVR